MTIFNKTKTYLILLSFTILAGCGGPTCDSDIRSNQWTDCSATKVYSSGTYKGEFKHGKAHGEGEYTFKSGSRYVGQFKNGNYEGQGTQFTSDNEIIYRGTFSEGKWHGEGEQFVGDESDTISGIFYEDEKWGIYTYTWTSGGQAQFVYHNDKNVGDVFNAQLFEDGSSEAKIVFRKGDTYVGSLDKYGQPHGEGTLTTKIGDVYIGLWDRQDFKNGTISFNDGAKYTGAVDKNGIIGDNSTNKNNGYILNRNRLFEGKGTFVSKDGSKYIGEWYQGLKYGQGKLICSNGKVYEGKFTNDTFGNYSRSNDRDFADCGIYIITND